jgi:ferredoxin-NADP reductase
LIDANFNWEVDAEHLAKKGTHTPPSTDADSRWLSANLTKKQLVANGVMELTFQPEESISWQAGAHIDVELTPGLIRQYSLCGDLTADGITPKSITIAVGGGEQMGPGATAAHQMLQLGQSIRIGRPRNNFRLRPTGKPVLLVAAGIGVTPLLPMARQAISAGVPVQFIFVGRCRTAMAYLSSLEALLGPRLTTWETGAQGRPDFGRLLEAKLAESPEVYACGPESFLDDLELACQVLGLSFHAERFVPTSKTQSEPKAFQVELAKSGKTISVSAAESLLSALNRSGVAVPSTCTRGTCGTCEVRVVSGQIDHRDVVLSRADRLAGDTMISCVSRCIGDKLILDLG